MKSTTFKIISISMLLILLTSTTKIAAAADAYLGDFCWRILAAGEPVENGSIYNLGLFYKGGNHFALYGTFDNGQAVHGNLEIVGDSGSVTLFGSADYIDEIVSETVKANLSLSTLSGPSHSLGITVNLNTNVIENFYVPHTMTFIACP